MAFAIVELLVPTCVNYTAAAEDAWPSPWGADLPFPPSG